MTAPASWRAFPTELLPEPAGGFVRAAAEALRVDEAFVALPLLSALAAAVGGAREAKVKQSWREPAILWTAIIGESGSGKSPALREVLRFVRHRQAAAMRTYREALQRYEADKLNYERELAAWKRSRDDALPMPEAPEPPACQRYVVSDTTTEALAPLLLQNPKGVLLACDELGQWTGGFDRYRKGAGHADLQHWLSMHVGDAITVDRKHSAPIFVRNAIVSVTGGLVPDSYRRLIVAEHSSDGLLPRLLVAMPPRRKRGWTDATIDPGVRYAVESVFGQLYGLEPTLDEHGDPRPAPVLLDDEARRAFAAFVDEVDGRTREARGVEASIWSKAPAHAARLALVLHFTRWADGAADEEPIEVCDVAAGVEMGRWFALEALRVLAELEAAGEREELEALAKRIERWGGAVTARELVQRDRRFRGNLELARAKLRELADAGFGRIVHDPPGPQGGRPSERFVVACLQNPDSGAAAGGFVDVDNVDARANGDAAAPDPGPGEWAAEGERPPDSVYLELPEAWGSRGADDAA